MITLFYPLNSDNVEAIRIRTNYFEPLNSVLEKFNNHHNKTNSPISKLYNKYGQEIPLTYQIQKTNLDVYFNLSDS